MASPATQGSLSGSSNGFVASIIEDFKKGVKNVAESGIEYVEKYAKDQWGLSKNNGVTQVPFQNQLQDPGQLASANAAAGASAASSSSVKSESGLSSQTVVLLIGGALLFLLLRG